MTVQTTAGALDILATDFQRTDHGITWCIKCHDIPGYGQAIYALIKKLSGWEIVATLDDGFDIRIVNMGGDVHKWFTDYFIPKLNVWLSDTFLAGAAPVEPTASPFEQADIFINTILTFTLNPDGTIVASLK